MVARNGPQKSSVKGLGWLCAIMTKHSCVTRHFSVGRTRAECGEA